MDFDSLLTQFSQLSVEVQPARPTSKTLLNYSTVEEPSSKKNPFHTQYNQVYSQRLKTFKEILSTKKDRLSLPLELRLLSDIGQEEQCLVIGTIYREMKEKKSYLLQIESSKAEDLYPEPENVSPSSQDILFLEDFTGRRRIFFDKVELVLGGEKTTNKKEIDMGYLVTGTCVMLEISSVHKNILQVKRVYFAGLNQEEPKKKIQWKLKKKILQILFPFLY